MGLEPAEIIEICNKIDVSCEALYGFDTIAKSICYGMSLLKKIPTLPDELLERVQKVKIPLHTVIVSTKSDGLIKKIRDIRKKGITVNLLFFIGNLENKDKEKLKMYGINTITL